MLWFSLVIGQNTSPQLATSSENLVAVLNFWSHWWPVNCNFEPCYSCTLLFLRKNSLVIITSGKEIKENKKQVRKPNFQKCGWSHLVNYYTTNNLVDEQSANLHCMNWKMSDLFGKFSHQFIFLIHHGDNMVAACCVNYRTRYKLQV